MSREPFSTNRSSGAIVLAQRDSAWLERSGVTGRENRFAARRASGMVE
jgi:hypothetical protein